MTVLIKWHRNDPWENKYLRKSAVYWAKRKIRQQTKLRLKNLDNLENFIQPTIRLGYFD